MISALNTASNAAARPQGASLKMRRKCCVFAAAEFFPITNSPATGTAELFELVSLLSCCIKAIQSDSIGQPRAHDCITYTVTCSGAAVLRILCEGYGSLHSVFLHLLDGIFRQRLNVPEPDVELVRSWRDREAMGNGVNKCNWEKPKTQILDLYIDQVIKEKNADRKWSSDRDSAGWYQ